MTETQYRHNLGQTPCLEAECPMFKETGQFLAQHKVPGKFRSLPRLPGSTFAGSICTEQSHYGNSALGPESDWLFGQFLDWVSFDVRSSLAHLNARHSTHLFISCCASQVESVTESKSCSCRPPGPMVSMMQLEPVPRSLLLPSATHCHRRKKKSSFQWKIH